MYNKHQLSHYRKPIKSPFNQSFEQQKGMALLMAIMIVALVAIISVNMLTQRQLQVYRTANLYFKEQAYQYTLAIERWGISVLAQDLERKNKEKEHFDSYQDIWNTAIFDFDVEQATINGVIIDLQGRFNLNNLVVDGKVNKKWEASYKRLLQKLNLSLTLSDSLVDWLDNDEQSTGSSGAEDIYYIALDNPYRASNQALTNISELYLVKNYDNEAIEQLKPHIFVSQNESPVNINTCTVEVLQAIVPGLLGYQAESILKKVEEKPFSTIDQFMKDPLIQDKAIESSQISVTSNYFSIISHVLIDKTKVSLQSIIERNEKEGIKTLNRQESIWYQAHSVKNDSKQEKKT